MISSGRGVTEEDHHLVDAALPRLVDAALPESGRIGGRGVTVTAPSLVDVALRLSQETGLEKPFRATTGFRSTIVRLLRPFHESDRRQELCLYCNVRWLLSSVQPSLSDRVPCKKQRDGASFKTMTDDLRTAISGGTVGHDMPRGTSLATGPIRLAIWYGKGGVGKSTTTMLLSLLAANQHQRVLAVDLDPECGTSRDFLGPQLRQVTANLRTFLDSPLPESLPIIPSGIDCLDIVPGVPDDQRFFRFFPEHSSKLRDGLDLLPSDYRWVVMDVPNQYDNIAQLGLIAADYLILPVELTGDCAERVETALRTISEARSSNPGLKCSAPCRWRPLPVPDDRWD